VVEVEGQKRHNSNQAGFGLPAFSSTRSASYAVQKAVVENEFITGETL
jgi:hypothetical protein